jgi:hypothetical protein
MRQNGMKFDQDQKFGLKKYFKLYHQISSRGVTKIALNFINFARRG